MWQLFKNKLKFISYMKYLSTQASYLSMGHEGHGLTKCPWTLIIFDGTIYLTLSSY